MLDEVQPFAIALLLGIAVGIERERSQPESETAMGVRTFSLLAMLGAVCGTAAQPALTAGLCLVLAALTLASYWRSEGGTGVTTEVAAGLVFGLGYLAVPKPALAGIIGLVVVTVLHLKQWLHWFSREVLRPKEINAVLILLIFVLVVVPFIPDRAIDPFGLVNLRRLGQITAMIAGIEFLGYVVERFAGMRAGIMVASFFGGLASSTAVFTNLPRLVRQRPASLRAAIGGGLLATTATMILYLGVVIASAPGLTTVIAVPTVVMIVVAALGALAIGHATDERSVAATADGEARKDRSPLDLRAVAKLSLFIFALILAVTVVRRTIGAQAVGILSFVGGLFELQSVALATASLHTAGQLSEVAARESVLLALVASFVSKLAIVWTLGFGRFALAMTGALLLVLGAGAAAYYVMLVGW